MKVRRFKRLMSVALLCAVESLGAAEVEQGLIPEWSHGTTVLSVELDGLTLSQINISSRTRSRLTRLASTDREVCRFRPGGIALNSGHGVLVDLCPVGRSHGYALYSVDTKLGTVKRWRDGLAVHAAGVGGPFVVYDRFDGVIMPFGVRSFTQPVAPKPFLAEQYSIPHRPVPIDDGTVALFAPTSNRVMVVRVDNWETRVVPNSLGCRPLAWRSKTRQLLCSSGSGQGVGYSLLSLDGRLRSLPQFADAVEFVIGYVPSSDSVVGVRTRTGRLPWKEHEDLVMVSFDSARVEILERDTKIDVTRSVLLLSKPTPTNVN